MHGVLYTLWLAAIAAVTLADANSIAKPAWMGSREGITDKVLPPWKPLEVKKKECVAVSMYGRSYEFGDAALLRSARTQGCPILSRPMRLLAETESGVVKWQSSLVRMNARTPAKLVLTQTASAPGINLVAKTEVEYDGLAKTELRLTVTKPCTLNGLTLEIPLARKYATYYYSYPHGLCDWFTYPGDRRPGALPSTGRLEGAMVPILWLGDENLGLGCFWESTRNWYNKDPHKVTEIVCDGEEVIVRYHLIDRPVRLQPVKTLDYLFAVQATPVKPVDKTCWDYRIATCPWYGEDYALLTRQIEGKPALDCLAEKGVRALILLNWTKTLAYTKPVGHEEALRNLVREAHKRGLKVLPYFGFQLSELAPEWPLLGDEVVNLRQLPTDPSSRGVDHYPGEPEQYVNRICYHSVMQDFLVDGIARLMDEYDIDGVYLDTTAYPSLCRNRKHGCGYVNEHGDVVGTHPVFATRETLRRIYTVVKTRKPDGLVDLHNPVHNLPALSWATSTWDGESLPKLGNKPVLKTLPLDRFRTEYMGHALGTPAEFLHYTLLGATPEGFRKAQAVSLIHGIPTRLHAQQLENLNLVSSLWRAFDELSRRDSQWLPYWDNSKYVSVEGDGVYASLYKHPKKGVLMVVSSLKKETDARLTLDLRELGLPEQLVAFDALTREPETINGNRIDLRLSYLGWAMIWVRPVKQ